MIDEKEEQHIVLDYDESTLIKVESNEITSPQSSQQSIPELAKVESSIKLQQELLSVIILRDNTIFHSFISIKWANYFYHVRNLSPYMTLIVVVQLFICSYVKSYQ